MDGTVAQVMEILTAHRIAVDRLEPETGLDQAGMDSLLFLDIVLAIETHFGIAFSSAMMVPETFETPVTIASAVARLREASGIGGQTSAGQGAAAPRSRSGG